MLSSGSDYCICAHVPTAAVVRRPRVTQAMIEGVAANEGIRTIST
jgi:hypothetical protein